MQMREKVGKSRNTVFFQWFGALEGRKVGSLKRRVRSQLARWEMKKCTPLWREAHFEVKMYKTPQLRTAFGSWDVEKVHAVVARSTFRSQNAQNTHTLGPDHFWQLRCRKSARRRGAKHICKSKCTKHTMYGPFLAVEMHAVVARSTFRSRNVQNTLYTDHFWTDVVSRGRRNGLWTLSKVSKTWGFCSIFNYNHHYTTLHSNTLHYTTTTTTTTPSLHSTTLHSTTLHSITFNSTTLHYTTLHSTTLHYTTLHYTTLHYTTLPSITLHYTTLHSTRLQLHLQLHSATLNYTTVHYTTFHDTPLHYTTLHYTTLHWMTLHHR